ncbi:hypothetical protein [Azospirillum largimobile]
MLSLPLACDVDASLPYPNRPVKANFVYADKKYGVAEYTLRRRSDCRIPW